MELLTASLDLGGSEYPPARGVYRLEGPPQALRPGGIEQEALRKAAWEIGERKSGDWYVPPHNLVGLGMVHPVLGFAYWRLRSEWVDEIARSRGGAWDGARQLLRLYDVSYLEFTGLNAHRIQDHDIGGLTGQFFFNLPGAGGSWICEVGFLLRSGEFIPAARSPAVPFAPDAPSRLGEQSALLVTGPARPSQGQRGVRVEQIGNVWDQERELRERRRPHLRYPLRILALAFASRPSGQSGQLADFVTELAAGQRACGHEVHVFVPAEDLRQSREVDGAWYHPLAGITGATAMERAASFAKAAELRMAEMPPFDLIHMHEWMTGLGRWLGNRPAVLSLTSIEATRRQGPTDALSAEIEKRERRIARSAGCVLTPGWLRDRAVAELGIDSGRAHAFAMEGRLANEWECPLDYGHVKMRYGIGPLDRSVLFIGPLEHATGVDLLIEALPVILRRAGNARLAIVGGGPMRGPLERRAHELGVAWAVRFLGDLGGRALIDLLRSSEALVLPSRYRIAMDDAVVDMARKAGRPVITTHGGPAHLVRHEENGLVTYDNPGSMVWAFDRLLSDPGHAERMGKNGHRSEAGAQRWSEVARHYLESCVNWFPELTVTRM